VRLWRGGKVIATDKIDSLRRFKDDVREVQTGFECGIGLVSTSDIVEGDVIECYTTQTVSRSALS
jgi:translation initiation factor IF-2